MSALQAVDPNSLTTLVAWLAQRGQQISFQGPGGAIPASASFRRPVALMSSVVQAGPKTV
jgi:hypothetical protein